MHLVKKCEEGYIKTYRYKVPFKLHVYDPNMQFYSRRSTLNIKTLSGRPAEPKQKVHARTGQPSFMSALLRGKNQNQN